MTLEQKAGDDVWDDGYRQLTWKERAAELLEENDAYEELVRTLMDKKDRVGPDHIVVPREPTPQMEREGCNVLYCARQKSMGGFDQAKAVYKAMIGETNEPA